MSGPRTALIAEDEAPQRHELRAMLTRLWPQLTIVAECEDGLAAIEALALHTPDIAFLDIRMPGVSGLEVARQVGAATQLVFITAYDEFAVAAFEAGAADYLLKPIRADRLAETITRLRARHPTPQTDMAALLDTLAGQLAPRRAISWITASIGDTVRMIAIDEILFFQSEEKYTRVATAAESAHIRMSLKELVAQLDPDIFWQVHRGTIVRVSAIRHARPDEDGLLRLWLRDVPEPLRVSDAFRHRFRAM
jgi:DNA-binding LytR/AlgR family response regulator